MSKYIIETNHLTKFYGEQKALADINIHVKQGSIYGLLGRNGAGKSTLMKILLGLASASEGETFIFGMNVKKELHKILPRVGNLIETPGFYPNLTGYENLKLFARMRGVTKKNAIEEALTLVGLNNENKKLFSEYSLGMKQRLAIALAVMHDPELLILDEPINGLDPIGIAEVRKLIRSLSEERRKTILISSHILSEISLVADDIGIIDHGTLLEESSLEELENKNKVSIQFQLSDVGQASIILQEVFKTDNFKISGKENIEVYDTNLPIAKMNKAFVESGIDVHKAYLFEESLEDYFKKITGGEGIA
ncbi:ABC transporter ATP-binding protein [Enterococcus avium]|jgi:ABC-type multidrug transport system ATPase subunit|uniref:ABC transporter ATP-binding protein n=1 Tax=Enterococcus avium TaxID=33945 RepID=UPI000F50ACF8|nr:ABC transporter ATP-binding protein [Enterococcus avium]NSS37833.1 ABC transporter ATP-binding protein [Enterococcus faecalis]ROZ31093.1 ABC transporter ATP-binding protein [Enterococcus avium]